MTAFVLTTLLAVAPPVLEDAKKAEAQFRKDVEKARAKAIDFLKKQQKPDGSWEGVLLDFVVEMKGGSTGLATLAMLEAGVPANDAAVAKAVDYLVKLEPAKTYVVSLQTQVLARVDAQKHAPRIQKNVDWLLEKAIRDGDRLEGWSYPINKIADGSNTHFAVVALHAAARAGAKIDAKVWDDVRDMYERTRQRKGWGYYFRTNPEMSPATLSMTTCGLLGLALVAKHDEKAKGPGEAFNKGMEAMIDFHGPSSKSEGYRLFATAELGRLLGGTEFKAGRKERAWYRGDAEKLLKKQNEDGSWKLGESIDRDAVLSTAFALYFLGPPPKS